VNVSSLGFQTDLMALRLEGSTITDRGDHLIVRSPHNASYHWGNFVLAGAELSNASRWSTVFAEEFPNAGHVAIGLDASTEDATSLDGYRAAGLEPDLSIVLTASAIPGAAAALDGVTLRSVTSDDDWDQALQLRYAISDDDSEQNRAFGAQRLADFRGLTERGYGTWYGAFIDGQLQSNLGVVTHGTGLARYRDVDTHPDFQRRGLARALITLSGQAALARPDVQRLVIVADPDYHAIALYRSLGFVDTEAQVQVHRAD
jgi:ribosomal protein S18 acetylase RimI-like enzyme